MGAIERAIAAGGKYGVVTPATVGTSGTLVHTFNKESRALRILNRHATAILSYSIDGGTDYFSIGPFGMIELPLRASTLHVKSDTVDTGYDIQFVEAQ